MQYGCIGEKLSHSFSKEIHKGLADYSYELKELSPDEVAAFLRTKDFKAINVTIPYKQTVMPYLDHISQRAGEIGAVNTIVNRDGVLYGYNTDFYGLDALLKKNGIVLQGKKVLILGSGGTSKTALAVARAGGAADVSRVSRSKREGCITYDEALSAHGDAQIIINTTPCGMYPNVGECPIDIDAFPRLSAVVDAIYNPLCSALVLAAREKGITAAGGLYMLVMQAAKAVEFFLGAYPDGAEALYQRLLREKQNIVLIGMPACGKSSVGAHLQAMLDRELVDTDAMIVQEAKKTIPEIFSECGEQGFRDMESDVIGRLSVRQGLIIATGGGAILREENVRALRQNGVLFFLDRPLSELMPTADRPLSSDYEALQKRYEERYDKYLAAADIRIAATAAKGAESTAKQVIKEWTK